MAPTRAVPGWLLSKCNLPNRTRIEGPPFNFFGTVRLFSENFTMSPKAPFEFFDFLQQNGLCDIFRKNVLRVLSLRYGVDFGSSRLV